MSALVYFVLPAGAEPQPAAATARTSASAASGRRSATFGSERRREDEGAVADAQDDVVVLLRGVVGDELEPDAEGGRVVVVQVGELLGVVAAGDLAALRDGVGEGAERVVCLQRVSAGRAAVPLLEPVGPGPGGGQVLRARGGDDERPVRARARGPHEHGALRLRRGDETALEPDGAQRGDEA